MIRAILVDDERNALEVLKMQLQKYCPEVEIISICHGGEMGIQDIRKFQPDLVFLDIEMPMVNGFDVLNETKDMDYKVIFTTAYDQFAIKAFKYSAVDYLLKPIDIEELKTAVSKISFTETKSLNEMITKIHQYLGNIETQTDKIGLPFQGGYEMVKTKDIIRCESDSNYTSIFLIDNRKVLLSKTLKEVEESIRHKDFIRVHHSHLININHVSKFYKHEGGYIIMSDGTQVNISRAKKDEFFNLMNKV
ncbi:MAG: LytTR family DNA-binding domain-containing protein [Saprospiraceae bacterium]